MLALAEVCRLPQMMVPWLRDQAAVHAYVADLAAGVPHPPFPMPYTTSVWHHLLLGLFEVFGEPVMLPRLLAAGLAAAATVGTWLLARQLLGTAGTIVATALTALSPLLLSTPSVGLPNDPSAIIASVLLLLIGLRRDSLRWVGGAGLVIGLAGTLRFFPTPMVPVLVAAAFAGARPGRRIVSAVAFGVGATIGLLPLFYLLLGTQPGRDALQFVRQSATGTSVMHTQMGEGMSRSVLQRGMETWVSCREILLGRMNVAGPVPSQGANPAALLLGVVGVGLALFRGVRPRTDFEVGDRLIAVWIAGALALLTLVVAWPAEQLDGTFSPWRAPRYFVLLFPAPWIASGALIDVALRGPKVAAGLGWIVAAAAVVLSGFVSLGQGALHIPPGQTTAVLEDAWTTLSEEWHDAPEGTLIFADLPPGSARRWSRPRFRRTWSDVLEGLDFDVWSSGPAGMALRHPQMLYQVHPELLSIDLALPGRPTARIDLLEPPLPPLGPIRRGAEPVGPARHAIVMVSSTRVLEELAVVAPSAMPHPDDRVGLFAALQPEMQPVDVVVEETRALQPGFALYRFDLAPVRWPAIRLRIGSSLDGARDPSGPWAFGTTLYEPFLGYGFDHAWFETVYDAVQVGAHGLRPLVPNKLRIDVPPGPVQGAVVLAARCDGELPPISVLGTPLVADPSPTCTSNQWIPRVHRFCVQAPDGQIAVELTPEPVERRPWVLSEVGLEVAPEGCP